MKVTNFFTRYLLRAQSNVIILIIKKIFPKRKLHYYKKK